MSVLLFSVPRNEDTGYLWLWCLSLAPAIRFGSSPIEKHRIFGGKGVVVRTEVDRRKEDRE